MNNIEYRYFRNDRYQSQALVRINRAKSSITFRVWPKSMIHKAVTWETSGKTASRQLRDFYTDKDWTETSRT